MLKYLRRLRLHLSLIRNDIFREPLNRGKKLYYLGQYLKWHLFYKYRGKKWIITLHNGMKSIVYPFPDHDAGELRIWTENYDFHAIEHVRSFLKKGDTIVDAGCNVGNRTLALADICSRAILIDAGDVAARRTKENIELNGLSSSDYVVVHKAVGDEPSTIYFTNLGGASTLNKIVSSADEADDVVEMEQVTIDQLMKEYNMQPAFIKTDVEGFDLQALQGGLNTLKSGSVQLVMFEHTRGNTEELGAFRQFFDSIGWKMYGLDKDGRLEHDANKMDNMLNLFARPASTFN